MAGRAAATAVRAGTRAPSAASGSASTLHNAATAVRAGTRAADPAPSLAKSDGAAGSRRARGAPRPRPPWHAGADQAADPPRRACGGRRRRRDARRSGGAERNAGAPRRQGAKARSPLEIGAPRGGGGAAHDRAGGAGPGSGRAPLYR